MKQRRLIAIFFAASVACAIGACFAAVASPSNDEAGTASACPADAGQPLAFWLGHWDAFADGKLDGRSFIESTLGGCAVLEHWSDASGFEGMSLFYLDPHSHQWKQVWITDHAFAPGGMKEKTMIFSSPDSVRFQGTVWIAPDRSVLDRTTLRKLDDGNVNQVIEYSKDGGVTWKKTYDSVYHRHSRVPAPT